MLPAKVDLSSSKLTVARFLPALTSTSQDELRLPKKADRMLPDTEITHQEQLHTCSWLPITDYHMLLFVCVDEIDSYNLVLLLPAITTSPTGTDNSLSFNPIRVQFVVFYSPLRAITH